MPRFITKMESLRAPPRGMGVGLSHHACVRKTTRQCVPQRTSMAVRRWRPSPARQTNLVVAAVGNLDPIGIASGAQAVPAIVASVAACIGVVLLRQNLVPEQDRFQGREPCPTCGGTGYEACFCSKWSDGDVGCNTCGYTGYMKCRSCGGGGTAVPVPITVREDRPTGTPF